MSVGTSGFLDSVQAGFPIRWQAPVRLQHMHCFSNGQIIWDLLEKGSNDGFVNVDVFENEY